jgi:hypothetical protein
MELSQRLLKTKRAFYDYAGGVLRRVGGGRIAPIVGSLYGQVFDVPAEPGRLSLALALGQYEKDELFILDSLGSWQNIIEIGANIGVVSRFAFLNNLDLDGRYICVEPNPHSIPYLVSPKKPLFQSGVG